MMRNRASSSGHRGQFVSVDGPSGAGKTTIVGHLAQMLVARGEHVHVTAEPSHGRIGALAAELTETVTGQALACLYTADRFHHTDMEITPHLQAGSIVVCDRYIASGLVVQRFDDVALEYLWQLNRDVLRPNLAVILEADPDVIAQRLAERGPHNRFQLAAGSSHREVRYYREATLCLINAGYAVLRVDCGDRRPEQSASLIHDQLLAHQLRLPRLPTPSKDRSS
jgi:dTMP kinase